MTFEIHDKKTAPGPSRPLLEAVEAKYGFVPNLLGVLAASPAALEAYLAVGAAFDKTRLTPVERQVVLLAVSFANRCRYCMAAHSTAAKMAGAPEEVVAALREGRPLADARLEALRRFATALVEKRGWLGEDDLEAFRAAGFDEASVLEILVGVALKTMSNYANHLAHTPLDAAFAPAAWTPPAKVGA